MSVDTPAVPVKFTLKDYKSDLHNDWCPGCIAPSTAILTPDGARPIAEIRVGDLVLGHDRAYHRVTEVMSHQHDGTLRRLVVKNFGEVLLTNDHPVYAVRRQIQRRHNTTFVPEWIPAEQVRPGDYVAYPVDVETTGWDELPLTYVRKKKDTRSKPLPRSVMVDGEFLRLAGYYIAEGWTHRREIAFTFSSEETDLVEDTVRLIGQLFELKASVSSRPDKHTLEVHVSSSYLTEIFGDMFGRSAEDKRIPAPFLTLAPQKQASLLRGLWAGDGYWGPKHSTYRTISPTLVEHVKLLLLRQGIVPSIHIDEPKGIHKRAYAITVGTAEGYNRLAGLVGAPAHLTRTRQQPSIIRDGYVFLRVRSNAIVEYSGMVHNLEVEDAHSYVTSAGALHNCGDFGILTGVQMALAQLNLDPDKVACFSGIGCSGKTPHYIKAYGFHTLHGRVLPVATGGRLVNSSITVLAMGGDGDGYGIGAGYFVNSGRRNLDFTYIVHNNNVYGLTKGQASPTLSRGKKTKSMPEMAIQDGINPIAMAIAAGYTFIARAYALEPKYLAGILVKAIQHKGSALVDVLQTCPTYNDLYTKEWYEGADLPDKKSRLYKLEEQGYDGKVKDVTDTSEIIMKKAAAVARSYETEPIPVGIYYQAELPTYEDGVNARIPILAEKPLVEVDTFNRDVSTLLDAMR